MGRMHWSSARASPDRCPWTQDLEAVLLWSTHTGNTMSNSAEGGAPAEHALSIGANIISQDPPKGSADK